MAFSFRRKSRATAIRSARCYCFVFHVLYMPEFPFARLGRIRRVVVSFERCCATLPRGPTKEDEIALHFRAVLAFLMPRYRKLCRYLSVLSFVLARSRPVRSLFPPAPESPIVEVRQTSGLSTTWK